MATGQKASLAGELAGLAEPAVSINSSPTLVPVGVATLDAGAVPARVVS